MLEKIKELFGLGPSVDMASLVAKGAVIVDVRTAGEYAAGHLKSSVNIPLSDLGKQMNKLKKDVPVITCCASGIRSGSAKGLLQAAGFKEVYNGGSWQSLKKYDR